ncbi:uncharacterized protein LOC126781798 [Nymphalis io]|uniref:uncharacterized protein LOC126781798 n=1 Tax=Inachis io TaxID=171585 RepID=UPI00216A7ADB|nr:uncharacterized protein LOC126781798 [Nymphalis io]
MKFLLVSAALVAVAFASPVLVKPDITGPSPIVNDDSYEAIFVDPAIVDKEDISVGPAIVEGEEEISVGPAIVEGEEEISVGPAIIDEEEGIAVGPEFVDDSVNAPASPIVQIILNINSQTHVIDVPINAEEVAPTPVIVVDDAEVSEVVPDPVLIGNPQLPVVPTPVEIGTPQLPVVPSPVITLPDQLN